MSLLQALVYFVREAVQSALRSWRVSLVAVLTLAVSLFLCGLFLLVLQNLSSTIEGWRSGLRVVVYLEGDVSDRDRASLEEILAAPAWVRSVEAVDPEEAASRFRRAFPGLERLTSGFEESPFPASLEGVLEPSRVEDSGFEAWIEKMRGHAGVAMVDADRDWLDQLTTALGFVTAAALALGATFLLAAALTSASILRLVAHLQREETSIMRLVGATEFFIRGPFYVEGLLYGLAASAVALAALAFLVVASRGGAFGNSLWSSVLFSEYLGVGSIAWLIGTGAATGSGGAVVSLRRERFVSAATDL